MYMFAYTQRIDFLCKHPDTNFDEGLISFCVSDRTLNHFMAVTFPH